MYGYNEHPPATNFHLETHQTGTRLRLQKLSPLQMTQNFRNWIKVTITVTKCIQQKSHFFALELLIVMFEKIGYKHLFRAKSLNLLPVQSSSFKIKCSYFLKLYVYNLNSTGFITLTVTPRLRPRPMTLGSMELYCSYCTETDNNTDSH